MAEEVVRLVKWLIWAMGLSRILGFCLHLSFSSSFLALNGFCDTIAFTLV